ncbi:MAG TPA: cytochrome c [Gaiellaceae bacterium]|nr:cytochrome c [Gaiellaceae bacterium]
MARTRRTQRGRRRRLTYVAAEAALVLLAVALAFGAGTIGFVVGRESAEDDPPRAEATEGEATETGATEAQPTTGAETTGETATETGGQTETTETGTGGGDGAADGERVFASAGCASCHTLSAAGATGTVGPNLDETQLSEEEIAQVVTNGRDGMPSFAGQLSEDEIRAVAAFVAGG